MPVHSMDANVGACFLGTLILFGSESSTLCSFSRFFLAACSSMSMSIQSNHPIFLVGRSGSSMSERACVNSARILAEPSITGAFRKFVRSIVHSVSFVVACERVEFERTAKGHCMLYATNDEDEERKG